MDYEHLIEGGGRALGVLIISGIVFAESGLLFGFFLPGDTLLLSAGVLAAQGKLPIIWLLVSIVVSAILGDNVGYSIGRRAGPRIFRKKDGIFFRHEHIERAEKFYEKHGGKTIVLARFIPVVRTFAPVVAGVGKMSRQRFFAYNLIGGLTWGLGVTLLGYFFGSKIPNIDNYIMPVIAAVMLLTIAPALYHLLKDKEARQMIAAKLKMIMRNIFLNKKVD